MGLKQHYSKKGYTRTLELRPFGQGIPWEAYSATLSAGLHRDTPIVGSVVDGQDLFPQRIPSTIAEIDRIHLTTAL